MPVKREFKPVSINVADGGVLAPDYPPDQISRADYTRKENFRHDDGAEEEREGWLDYRPNSGVSAATSRVMGSSVQQIGEARRANGEVVPVGVSGNKVYWWSWTTGQWTQIGSGYSATPASRWQIVNVGSYTVFNNGTDLPFTWVIGDAAVTPIYELREQGYASVREITQSNGMLLCFDITEILPAELSGILNGTDPYGLVAANKTQRKAYLKLWSNIGNPRDFAAVVAGSGSAGSPNVTMAWPMTSFQTGDEIIVIGGGTAGGNLTTTVDSTTSGTGLVLTDNLITAVTNAQVLKSTALNSVVGSYELEDDGSAVLRALPLQNRVVAYKSSGEIFVGYFTGDLDEPWVYDRIYRPDGESRGLRFPYTLVDVAGRYHLYAGDRHFYTFSLGSQEPQRHPVLRHCEKTLFFKPIAAATSDYSTVRNTVFAAVNGATSEVFFKVPNATPANSTALAYDFANEKASVVTGFNFACASTIRKPTALKTSDEQELWFIMGGASGADGVVTTYGRSNLNLLTMTRNGSAFNRIIESGYISFGEPNMFKDVTRYGVNCDTANRPITAVISVTDAPQSALSDVYTKSNLNGSGQPTLVGVFKRAVYFRDRIVTVPTSSAMRISGRVWHVALVEGNVVPRMLV